MMIIIISIIFILIINILLIIFILIINMFIIIMVVTHVGAFADDGRLLKGAHAASFAPGT